jgi:CPA2 family monovalent cation:H+ antiporter-2
LVFGVTLAAAGGSSLLGFSGAIAAFLVGLLLTGEVADTLRSRFAPLRELFSAIFFLIFGLSISALDVVAVLPIALLFAAVGIIGKFAVGWWIARDMADPMSWKRIGAFLSARGEFSMIIAGAVAINASMDNLREITLAIVVITATFSTIAIRAFRSRFEH